MNYALSRPSTSHRGGLLSAVIALHGGALLLALAAKTVAPQIMEMPLVVDLLQPDQPRAEAKPQPENKPTPVRQKVTPRAPAPVPETTTSDTPAPAAPTVVPAPPQASPSPAPVAETLTQARFDADYLRNPAPPYPPLSKRMGEEGKVVLRVLVSPTGSAETVEIKSSSGSTRLDEAALNTVRQWRFVAARRGDTPVQSWVLVPIIFKLEH